MPGNDDAIRSISLFTRAVSDACLEGSKLATGLKPSADSSGPKIIKKEEKQESSNEKDLEEAKVKEPKEVEESKEKEESVEAEEQKEDSKVDSKSEEVEEGKET